MRRQVPCKLHLGPRLKAIVVFLGHACPDFESCLPLWRAVCEATAAPSGSLDLTRWNGATLSSRHSTRPAFPRAGAFVRAALLGEGRVFAPALLRGPFNERARRRVAAPAAGHLTTARQGPYPRRSARHLVTEALALLLSRLFRREISSFFLDFVTSSCSPRQCGPRARKQSRPETIMLTARQVLLFFFVNALSECADSARTV